MSSHYDRAAKILRDTPVHTNDREGLMAKAAVLASLAVADEIRLLREALMVVDCRADE